MEVSSFFTAENLELTIRVILQCVLLISSAFFSGSETALFSLTRLDLQKLRNSRDSQSDSIHAMLDEPRRLIISILCGNELVNIASAANMAGILLVLVGPEDAGWVNIVVMVPMLLLVGEVTPKTFAVTFPIKFSTVFSARLLPRWIDLIGPLREMVRYAADYLTTLIVGKAEKKQNILDPDEFRTLIEESEETGVLDTTERVLINNMLEASKTEVVNIMTPRTRVEFLREEMPLPEMLKAFRKIRHPRVPVISDTRDCVLGFMRSEQVAQFIRSGAPQTEEAKRGLINPAHFVPATKKVDEMFDYFKKHNNRVVIILSEDGAMVGMVTMKDVLMFTFRGLSEREGKVRVFEKTKSGNYLLPGDMRLAEFNEFAMTSIVDPRMTTIGGFVFRVLGQLPKVGDRVVCQGVRFQVHEMETMRIKTLEVTQVGLESEATAEGIKIGDMDDISVHIAPDEDSSDFAVVGEPITVQSATSGDAPKEIETEDGASEKQVLDIQQETQADTVVRMEDKEGCDACEENASKAGAEAAQGKKAASRRKSPKRSTQKKTAASSTGSDAEATTDKA